MVEQVKFPGTTGAELSGVLHMPEQAPEGALLMAHCFTCSKQIFTMTRLARGLGDAGFAVLRFDFTGLGDSGGVFSDTTVSTNVGDLVAAAQMLEDRRLGPCGMFGHSLGGSAVLLAAHRMPGIRSVAVLGAPSSPAHIKRLFTAQETRIRREGEAVVGIAGRPFPISVEFLDDLDRHDAEGGIGDLERPLLVLQALSDEVVGVEQGERIFSLARQPKAFMPLMGADHLLTDPASTDEARSVLADWFHRTL